MNRQLMSMMVAALAATGVQAESEKPTATSDAKVFEGDRLEPRVDVRAKVYVVGQGLKEDVACLPPQSKLRGGQAVQAGSQSLTLAAVDEVGGGGACEEKSKAVKGQVLAIEPDLLASSLFDRRGWTYGTLIVPYKYQFRGDRSLSGGATVGGYFGLRNSVHGTSVQLVAFGGATKVEVPKTDAQGQTTTESLAGFSYGLGLLGTLKSSFKLGLVVGTDRVSKSAGYVNNGKPWVSLSLGVDFTQ